MLVRKFPRNEQEDKNAAEQFSSENPLENDFRHGKPAIPRSHFETTRSSEEERPRLQEYRSTDRFSRLATCDFREKRKARFSAQ